MEVKLHNVSSVLLQFYFIACKKKSNYETNKCQSGFKLDLSPALLQLCVVVQGLKNPLARRPGLVISTFVLAEIISCIPDGLVKKYIGY